MKREKVFWFSSQAGCLGIVLGKDEINGKTKGYIGLASGLDAAMDTEHIAATGQPLSPPVMKEISDYLNPKGK